MRGYLVFEGVRGVAGGRERQDRILDHRVAIEHADRAGERDLAHRIERRGPDLLVAARMIERDEEVLEVTAQSCGTLVLRAPTAIAR